MHAQPKGRALGFSPETSRLKWLRCVLAFVLQKGHAICVWKARSLCRAFAHLGILLRPESIELPTFAFGARRSIRRATGGGRLFAPISRAAAPSHSR